jgi:hypothetical protein
MRILRSVSPLLAIVLWPALAGADLDGKWKQSPVKEEWTVQRWTETACGPAPVNNSTGGGEQVTVSMEGDNLSIIGGGRVYKSNKCYDEMPTLVRDSYQRDPSGKIWRIHCSTPPNDPRRATLNTLVQVTSDTHVELAETGRYEITHGAGSCIADVKRTRSFDKISEGPVATTAPTATQPPASKCTSVGDPARLEVRPSRKLLRTGETFAFSAVVVDANGCGTGSSTTWKIDGDPKGVSVDDHGSVTVAADAPEGSVTIIVSAAGKSTKVTVDVSSPGHYDDLLKTSGLNASGETDTASIVVIAEGSIGGSDVRAEGSAKKKKMIFLAVVGGLVLVVAIFGVIGWRRSKRAEELQKKAEERHAEKLRDVEERQRDKAERHAAQQRAHEESLKKRARVEEEVRQASAKPPAAPPPGTICPSCQKQFPPDAEWCPHDGTRLVPMNIGAVVMPPTSADPPVKPGSRKICPTCGQRFEGEATFCGKDGSALVLIN